ncbi:MAG: hypothetical protein GY804_09645 [Alphaproteobacteria bacterium]|nr:hypothetical protein [Alphaproteobacteria bacterium]
MKNAEEYYSRSISRYTKDGEPIITKDGFERALTEHDNEIKELIDEMIEKEKSKPIGDLGWVEALTELKDKI